MPKGLYEIKDFSGGLNAYADPRDIKDSDFDESVIKASILDSVLQGNYPQNPDDKPKEEEEESSEESSE